MGGGELLPLRNFFFFSPLLLHLKTNLLSQRTNFPSFCPLILLCILLWGTRVRNSVGAQLLAGVNPADWVRGMFN